mmetsp:Transcript_10500/g.17381  ORF Transcript_10500/g.17381 Transcript_10500/m.17381 type:complete len:245 (-) Transcript_10500:48-782(-)
MSSASSVTPSTGGEQQGSPGTQHGSRGGGRNRGHKGRRHQTKSVPIQVKKFSGKEEGLGDEFVYQHTEGRDATDQYTRTTEEIICYSSTKYKFGADVERSLSQGSKLNINVPTAPALVSGVMPAVEMMVWKMKVQLALQRIATLYSNLESAYALIKGQCSKPILEKVEAQTSYSSVHSARDPMGLTSLIKGVMFNYNSRKERAVSIIDIMQVNIVSQTRYMTASEYLEKFRTQLDVEKIPLAYQ